jgi:long-subunit acyl-CoA synthetase (AMP-forming)
MSIDRVESFAPSQNTYEIAMPVGHVLVGHTGRHVEHDDGALRSERIKTSREEATREMRRRERNEKANYLALDVVAVAESTKLLLTGRVHTSKMIDPCVVWKTSGCTSTPKRC